jgi:hypothetical protein
MTPLACMSGQLEVVIVSGMLGVEMLESSRTKIVASTTNSPLHHQDSSSVLSKGVFLA